MEDLLKKLAVELYDVQALKFGDFKMKLGLRTPIYFDLRVIISYPKLMVYINDVMYERIIINLYKIHYKIYMRYIN